MSNVINFNSNHKIPEYTLHWESDGQKHSHKLTSDEQISTVCMKCRKRHYFEFDEFMSIMNEERTIHDTYINCSECSPPALELP